MRNLLAAGLGVLASLSAIPPASAFYIPGEQLRESRPCPVYEPY